MKKYIIADIHGEITKLKSLINKLPKEEDTEFIWLGDYVDRGEDVYATIEYLIELSKKYKCIFLKGNHDQIWKEDITSGNTLDARHLTFWDQGSKETLYSYKKREISPLIHLPFLESLLPYHKDEENNLFIHGGFNRHFPLKDQKEFIFIWDRDLWNSAMGWEYSNKEYPFKIKEEVKEIFIGHSPTEIWGQSVPMKCANIYNIDTGCGKHKEYKLSAIELYSKEIYQSDEIC